MNTHTAPKVMVSVGYERRDIDELVALLAAHAVEVLVDVRLNAISRKRGYSKTALADALHDAGIEYRHERELGNPKDNRDAFRRGIEAARDRYRHHLRNGASAAYRQVIELAHTSTVALLCYERDHEQCHRSCIIEAARASDDHLSVLEL